MSDMTNPYEVFETEEDLEKDGVWLDYGSWRVKAARAGGRNTLWAKEITKMSRKHNLSTTKNLGKEQSDKIMAGVYAKAVIKDWEVKVKDEEGNENWQRGIHLKDENGNVQIEEPTRKNITRALIDLPDLFEDIRQQTTEMSTYQNERIEEQVKN